MKPGGFGAMVGRGGLPDDVYGMLRMGEPRIAWALSVGVPFVPWTTSLRATWDTPDVQTIPAVGNDVRVNQDVIVDGMVARVTTDRTPENEFTNQSDYFLSWISNIEMTLTVTGGPPRYEIAPVFTPVSNLCDVFNGNSKWPFGWVLSYENALRATFRNRVQLAEFPTTIVVTIRGWQARNDVLQSLSKFEAVDRLRAAGYEIPAEYLSFLQGG